MHDAMLGFDENLAVDVGDSWTVVVFAACDW